MARRFRHLPVLLLLASLPLVQAADPPAPEDPWRGKTRTDIVNLLGDPTKAKKSGEGELLTYKLLRLDEDAVTPPSVTVLNVPGIGVVARMREGDSMITSDVTIEPTEVDRRGRAAGAGVGEQESGTISWDTETGKRTQSWEDKPAIRGKITLKFQLDATGNIERWSVSPKKAKNG